MQVEESAAESIDTFARTLSGFYCQKGKRVVDFTVSTLLLLLLSPLFALLSLLVKVFSPGPVLYLQERVGRCGKLFRIVKFRSMATDADRKGPGITSAGDARVTGIGRFLRQSKLDELPQLWNVFRGDMSLVGPRPEVPSYVALYDKQQLKVLGVRPGMTDKASITFRWEEELLSQNANPERYYQEVLLPRKLALNLEYIATISFACDVVLMLRTVRSVVQPRYLESVNCQD